MRTIYTELLKNFLHSELVNAKKSSLSTQDQMAESLAMSTRSYAYLAKGQSMCGTLSLVLFVIHYCEDPSAFFDEIRATFEAAADLF